MTVPYSNKVATSSFSCFLRLLFRWRGSIYKLLWKEFAVFALFFYLLGFTYRFILNPQLKKGFETLSVYCQEFVDLIPLAFVLGFYVSIVVSRFWEQFATIPYPTRMAMFVSALITGIDERGRMMRRTIMRYLCLSHLMTMAAISPPVKKRFPDYQHMSDAGFMLENEQRIIENMATASNKYFVPLIWSASLVLRARKEGRIKDDFAVKTLIDEINDYRGKCGTLFAYDYVTVPIVYTQVVTIAVYTFFMSCLMGRQFLDGENHGDLYFPLFTFLQFFFYMGWLKVAESLVNPFGEDDDDFDINGMIDKNLPMSYLIVDEMHNEHPELIKDQYWESFNKDIVVPYNEASEKFQTREFIGSAANINIPPTKAPYMPSVASNMSQMGSQVSLNREGKTPMLGRRVAKRLGRSTSRLSNMLRSNISRQSSRVQVTKEDIPSIPLHILDEEKLIDSNNYPSELMFRMSFDGESNLPTPQTTPTTETPRDDQNSSNIFDSQPTTSKQPATPPINQSTPTTNQPTTTTTPPSSFTQTDPFISKPQATRNAAMKVRTTSTTSSVSTTSKVFSKVDVSVDGSDGDKQSATIIKPQLPLQPQLPQQPLQPPPLQPQQPPPQQPPPLQPHPLSGQDKTIPDNFIPSSSSSSITPSSKPLTPPSIHPPPTLPLLPPTPLPHLPPIQPPSTSSRTLDPVMEISESTESFTAAVMDKLKEIRENK